MFRTIATTALAAVAALALATTATAAAPQVTPKAGHFAGTTDSHQRITFTYDARRGEVVNFAVDGHVEVRNAYARSAQISTADDGFNLRGSFSSPTRVSGTYDFVRNGHKVTARWSASWVS